MQAPGLRLAEMPPEVLMASSFLPGTPPRDPADRILAATAREYGYRLMTRDGPLLTYAGQGHLHVIAC
jgi:PIN domain nuclease of toxin-antitoxin system